METMTGLPHLLFIRLVQVLCATALLLAAAVSLGQRLPQSQELVFTRYRRTEADIVRIDIARQLRYNLTPRTGYDSVLLWSPDGRSIVFVSDREGPIGLFAMDSLGQRVWRVAAQTRGQAYSIVRWAEGGQRLYLIQGLPPNEQRVYAVNLDGTGFEELTENTDATAIQRVLDFDSSNPAQTLSPDGARTAFVAYRGGQWGLYLGDAQRDNAQYLGSAGRHYNGDPVWSQDGTRIAYLASFDEGIDIFVLDTLFATPQITRVTHDHEIEASVVWRP